MSRRATRAWFLRRVLGRVTWWASWRRPEWRVAVPAAPAVTTTRGPTIASLPVGPLQAIVELYGGPRLAGAALGAEVDWRLRSAALEMAYFRAVRAGRLTVYAADELAVRLLGRHPGMVWGEAWWEAIA